MNDRYLFRGKRVDNGEWATGYVVRVESDLGEYIKILSNEKRISPKDSEFDVYQIDPSTIGQCTGLRDKNGTLIFEGDKFRCVNNPKCEGVISWDENYVGFGWFNDVSGVSASDIEIIGTIHDTESEATP